jgi:hypothetical protein
MDVALFSAVIVALVGLLGVLIVSRDKERQRLEIRVQGSVEAVLSEVPKHPTKKGTPTMKHTIPLLILAAIVVVAIVVLIGLNHEVPSYLYAIVSALVGGGLGLTQVPPTSSSLPSELSNAVADLRTIVHLAGGSTVPAPPVVPPAPPIVVAVPTPPATMPVAS